MVVISLKKGFSLLLIMSNQAGSWLEGSTDLILDAAAAGQLVAVTDGDDDGGLEEKRIPSLWEGGRNFQHKLL